jgi:hypothetical protein
VLIFLTVSANPPAVIFAAALSYGVSGYLAWGWKRIRRAQEPKHQPDLF